MKKRYEKILTLEEQIQKKRIQQQLLKNQSIESTERKKRTRRLIQKGALLEKYFDLSHLSVEETEEVLKIFSSYVRGNLPQRFQKEKGSEKNMKWGERK
ncbi:MULTISPECIES: hypothetical protein [Enterococcus]|uniref:hypothetical protein n=1 Tax=Enterococcus TaxID=1350 RepID=UPI001376E77D|nr:hypothetical protein [Enterococcus hirae]EGO9444364.1 hypothetical protein [Enterococcus faecalis]EGP4751476.1 hypothetical protein [Enterococcus faecium]EKK5253743.1 hypothetical protein [Enterococcus faecalis]EME3503331.1 hypothetical protein [Enterococcus faecium]EME7093657.1 hypothetical protein [Enterococcus faecium]